MSKELQIRESAREETREENTGFKEVSNFWKDRLGDIVESLKYQAKETGLHISGELCKFLNKKRYAVKCYLGLRTGDRKGAQQEK